MCGCDFNFVCAKCAGTWLEDGYPLLPDDREDEQARLWGGDDDQAVPEWTVS